jgi:hypothetical protein
MIVPAIMLIEEKVNAIIRNARFWLSVYSPMVVRLTGTAVPFENMLAVVSILKFIVSCDVYRLSIALH